jgi:glycosyltransferase involved in cell wall biosynthesis
VTVGIPAFNEELNIGPLLRTILAQEESGFILYEVIVYSDQSTDNTDSIVRNIKDLRVKLISGTKRAGQFIGIKTIISHAKGDVIVLVDADIFIGNNEFLKYLVDPFYKESNVGLVSGRRAPYKVKTFTEKAINTSINAYDSLAMELNYGNNPYNCHGAGLALSKSFTQSIDYPKQIFSGDTYLYFACIGNGFKFRYAPKALYRYYLADNLKDAIVQYKRFLDIDSITVERYGDLIKQEYNQSKKRRLKYVLKEFIRDPIHTIAMFMIIQYCKRSRERKAETSPAWNIAVSTKKA